MNLAIINRPRVAPYQAYYQVAKRVMDLALCLLALPLIIPLMAICALAIRLSSPGPVFFVQDRVGKGGRRFRIYKFRTMVTDSDDNSHRDFMKAYVRGTIGGGSSHSSAFIKAFVRRHSHVESNGEIYKPFRAMQVTRIGRILRKTSLDELPQLINVIKGEMSIVGPRPNVPWEVEEYRGWHHERLEVLPGITGLAQVRGRSSLNFDSIVNYDIEYIEKQSLWLDLKILWWTLTVAIVGRGSK